MEGKGRLDALGRFLSYYVSVSSSPGIGIECIPYDERQAQKLLWSQLTKLALR